MKQSIHTENFVVEVGATSNIIEFTPKKGKIIGVCIYNNDDTKRGEASLKDQSGSPIVDSVDLRHWRNRDTGYNDSYIPIRVESQPMTFIIKMNSAVSGSDFKGQLVLIYDVIHTQCQ